MSERNSSSKRSKVNKFVSTLKSPPLTSLQWTSLNDRSHRQSKVWEFMGMLTVIDTTSGRSCAFDEDLIHCKLCFEEQLKAGKDGHMSKIYCAKKSTASGNHMIHASQKHKRDFRQEATATNPKLTQWLSSANNSSQPARNEFEFNRDVALYMCRDLIPFYAVEKAGFKAFCAKNASYPAPSASTVANTALVDVYSLVKTKVKELLSVCHAGSLLMDGWTDKHHCHPYFAVRFSFIHEWTFKIVTLAMQPVESHTALNLSSFVKETIAEFMPHHKKMILFNTTDSAANMKLLSKVLGHERVDCIAHCLHLLLTVDSLDKVPQLTALLQKCKDIINALHFKGHVIRSMQDISRDIEMFDRVNELLETLSEDACNPVIDPDSSDVCYTDLHPDSVSNVSSRSGASGHQTLKLLVCTRWNSALMMIESVLDLQSAVNEALKKIGKFDICLSADDICVLNELRGFLCNFKPLTLLVSECNPNLSLLPLLRSRVMKACEQLHDEFGQCTDSPAIIALKKLVRNAVDKRIKISELVKLSCCFDPVVRGAVLSNDECVRLLQDAYQNLMNEDSSVRHVLVSAAVKPSSVKQVNESDVAEVSAKKLRSSLLQVNKTNNLMLLV